MYFENRGLQIGLQRNRRAVSCSLLIRRAGSHERDESISLESIALSSRQKKEGRRLPEEPRKLLRRRAKKNTKTESDFCRRTNGGGGGGKEYRRIREERRLSRSFAAAGKSGAFRKYVYRSAAEGAIRNGGTRSHETVCSKQDHSHIDTAAQLEGQSNSHHHGSQPRQVPLSSAHCRAAREPQHSFRLLFVRSTVDKICGEAAAAATAVAQAAARVAAAVAAAATAIAARASSSRSSSSSSQQPEPETRESLSS